MIKISSTLMIIDEEITNFMRALDLCEKGKFFIKQCQIVFNTNKTVNENYFMDIINKSFEMSKENPRSPRIAAITWENNIFSHADVFALSDGMYEIFISRK